MTHPVGMLMTGCKKQQNILLAFHTFMELCEVKLFWDVQYFYNSDVDIIYMKAKTKEDAENADYYIPVSASSTISTSWIQDVQKKILGDKQNSSFILVIKDRDSSSVYYTVSRGLVPPLSPDSAKARKCLEEKQRYMQTELKKRKLQLFDEAKSALNNAESCSNDKVNDSTSSFNNTSTNELNINTNSNVESDIEIIEIF